jgi:hypothetical protein
MSKREVWRKRMGTGEGTVEDGSNIFKGKVSAIEMFLEVEVFNLNLKKSAEVKAFYGVGDTFKTFIVADEIDANKKGWTPIEKGQVFRAPFKRASGRKCHFTPKTVDESKCDNRRPFCDLCCPSIKRQGGPSIKIQAQRMWVAGTYDDGKRAWDGKNPSGNKSGKWSDGVKIGQLNEPQPTEELLARVVFYPENQESKYNQDKTEETSPLLNRILILQKGGNIEYVVDHFVSL